MTLSKTPIKAEYMKFNNKKVKFGRFNVLVRIVESETRVGSYDRGIAWTRRKYGILLRGRKGNWSASANHGKTWEPVWQNRPYYYEDFRNVIRSSKNKVILETQLDKELAFEQIQAINRRWDGPGYKWRK